MLILIGGGEIDAASFPRLGRPRVVYKRSLKGAPPCAVSSIETWITNGCPWKPLRFYVNSLSLEIQSRWPPQMTVFIGGGP